MMNTEEPMITIVKNKHTDEFSIHLSNFDSESGEGYTKEEAEGLISYLQEGIKHLNTCIEDYTQGKLFEEELYAEIEKTITG